MAKFELYKDNAGEFRWRYLASNGKIIAVASEGYKAKGDCAHGIEIMKRDATAAKVVDITAETAPS